MPKYTIAVEMTHTFESVENFEVEVEAQDKAEALILARNKAYDECECDAYDAELEESVINDLTITQEQPLEGEPIPPIRCDKTLDMFGKE